MSLSRLEGGTATGLVNNVRSSVSEDVSDEDVSMTDEP